MLCQGMAFPITVTRDELVGITHTAAVWPTGERIRVAWKLRWQRKKGDLNQNYSLRYNPFASGVINVKHEFLGITSVHTDVQSVHSDNLERNPTWLSQVQRGLVDRTLVGRSRDHHQRLRVRRRRGKGRTSLGTERVTTNVCPPSLTLQLQLGGSSGTGVAVSGSSYRP